MDWWGFLFYGTMCDVAVLTFWIIIWATYHQFKKYLS